MIRCYSGTLRKKINNFNRMNGQRCVLEVVDSLRVSVEIRTDHSLGIVMRVVIHHVYGNGKVVS